MKKVILVCMIALAAAFSITGCSSASALNDCCQSDSANESKNESSACCQDEKAESSTEKVILDIPDCCGGE